MNLSISNIAWNKSEDNEISKILNTYNINQIADVAAHQAHQLTGTTPADDNSSSEPPTPSLST